MKTREEFDSIRYQRRKLTLRVRLTLVVALEIVTSVLIAHGISRLLSGYINSPLLIIIISGLIISGFVTGPLSKWFFAPVKELCRAMEKVADGDFKVRLNTHSTSQEINELYSGFNLMVHELDSTEILQSDFVSNVSHEFKTPISAIEGYATLLSDCENLTEEQRRYVEKISFNTERLSSLVGNILLLSRLENQAINTQRECYRLDEQIRQSIVSLEPDWEKKSIEFDVAMDSVEYLGNESMMRHVWNNLIGNAIKFNPDFGMIRIRLSRSGGRIVFTVDDSGPGISDEAYKHIFDKFYQEDSSHRDEGNGLGLALVKRILAIEGGEVYAENLQGGGCRFTVTLNSD